MEFKPHVDAVTRDLILGLLAKDPAQRLGASCILDVKRHPFFNDVVWSTLRQTDPVVTRGKGQRLKKNLSFILPSPKPQ